MHDPPLMAVQEPLKDLPNDRFGVGERQRVAFLVQVLFHVQIKILEHQVELVFSVNDVNKVYDAGMIQFFQKRHLSDCGTWNALIAMLDFYLL